MHAEVAPEFTLAVRPVTVNDGPYLVNSWLNSIWKGSSYPARMQISRETFFRFHRLKIASTLQAASVLVAHPSGDSDTVLGYLVHGSFEGRPVVQYLYTRSAWRRIGIAKALLAAAGVDLNQAFYPVHTGDCDWLKAKHPGLSFNPYL